MERDALLAHGVAFCLNDRLLKCSDYSEGKYYIYYSLLMWYMW